MITVTIRHRTEPRTARTGSTRLVRVTAASIHSALRLVPGEVVFPIEPERYFAPAEGERVEMLWAEGGGGMDGAA